VGAFHGNLPHVANIHGRLPQTIGSKKELTRAISKENEICSHTPRLMNTAQDLKKLCSQK
jgi:hypothetical protein